MFFIPKAEFQKINKNLYVRRHSIFKFSFKIAESCTLLLKVSPLRSCSLDIQLILNGIRISLTIGSLVTMTNHKTLQKLPNLAQHKLVLHQDFKTETALIYADNLL